MFKGKMSTSLQDMAKYILLVVVLSGSSLLLVCGQSTPNSGCDYEQDVVPDRIYYVYSPNFPKKYPKGSHCRWIARAPTRSNIILDCANFSLPKSNDCTEDKFSVSLTGDPADYHKYCGTGTFTLTSESNKMLIELVAPYFSSGGVFACSLKATSQPAPPPEVCDCGWKKEVRIVNGYETGINEYPMMAGLVYRTEGLFCGGTIISNRYCLTAAHCLVNKLANNTAVLVGDHNIADALETSSAKLYRVASFIAHPQYNTATQVNDIALVRTQDYIIFSMEVGPACLPFRFPEGPVPGQQVDLLGWGTTEQAGPKSNVLMKTTVDVHDTAFCQQTFGSARVSGKQICTFREGTDACQADSGGPVLFEAYDNRVRLMGVISYGKGCAIQYPGVNTRVGSYLNWILQATADATYCVR